MKEATVPCPGCGELTGQRLVLGDVCPACGQNSQLWVDMTDAMLEKLIDGVKESKK